ncbi:MAG: PIN domain-containing protein [Actinobacteria bacterium]|nr:PIN domain-containing protein [Actinomycetota bacterium]
MDAFDADVLIYAATADHPLGDRVRALFPTGSQPRDVPVGMGSVLLLPEVLSKPLRERDNAQADALMDLLARLDLRDVDRRTARLATDLATHYRLRAADATHLATAMLGGADRFITNNSRDFTDAITEIENVGPTDL